MMKKIIIHMALSVSVLIFCVVPCSADLQSPGQYLLKQMNQVRKAPYETAVSLGYSPEYLRGRNIFPETVLPEMTADPSLQKRAAADLPKDFSMDWCSYTLPEMSETADPQELDVTYVNGVNRSAVISFLNYMSLERACGIFISHILKEELESVQRKALLSQETTKAGVFVSSGITEQGTNAWFFSFHLGGGVLLQEIQLLNLINQVRFSPQVSVSFTKNGVLPVVKNTSRMKRLLEKDYAPIFFDSALYHLLTFDTSPVFLNYEHPGYCFSEYDFSHLSETDPWATSDGIVSVSQVFSELLEKEFIAAPAPCEELIFSNEILFLAPKMNFFGDHGSIQKMIVGTKEIANPEYSDPEYSNMARLYILAFSDSNKDSLYNPGEEYVGLRFKVFDAQNHLVKSFETDLAGHAELQLPPLKSYIFRIEYTPNHIIERKVFLWKDQFLPFVLPAFRNLPSFRTK